MTAVESDLYVEVCIRFVYFPISSSARFTEPQRSSSSRASVSSSPDASATIRVPRATSLP